MCNKLFWFDRKDTNLLQNRIFKTLFQLSNFVKQFFNNFKDQKCFSPAGKYDVVGAVVAFLGRRLTTTGVRSTSGSLSNLSDSSMSLSFVSFSVELSTSFSDSISESLSSFEQLSSITSDLKRYFVSLNENILLCFQFSDQLITNFLEQRFSNTSEL